MCHPESGANAVQGASAIAFLCVPEARGARSGSWLKVFIDQPLGAPHFAFANDNLRAIVICGMIAQFLEKNDEQRKNDKNLGKHMT